MSGGAARTHGRHAELGTLQRRLEAAREGHGGVVVLEGEPGIGKSRLLADLARAAEEAGFAVFAGRGDDVRTAQPFGPLVHALDLRTDADDEDAALAGRLLAAEADAGTAGPSSAVVPLTGEVRVRILEAVLGIVDRSTARGPVLLVVDDVHWADEDTLFVLVALGRRIASIPLLLAVASRRHPRPVALASAIGSLQDAGADVLAVDPLTNTDVSALVGDLVGRSPGPALLDEVGRAGGNPFLVIELVSTLSAAGNLVEQATAVDLAEPSAGERIDPTALAREAVFGRLDRLAPDTVELLRVATVLGRTFSLTTVRPVLGWPAGRSATAVTEALASGILQEAGDDLAFSHDLVREAIYAELPGAVRSALHLDAALALAGAGADALAVASQYQRTAELGSEGIDWMVRAAEQVHATAPSTAAAFWQRAADELPADDERVIWVHCRLADALTFSGRLKESEALARGLLQRGGLDHEGERAAAKVLGQSLFLQGRLPEAAAVLEEGVADTDPDRAQILADTAFVHLLNGEVEDALAKSEQAEAAAVARDDPVGETAALCAQSWVVSFRGELERAVEIGQRAVARADTSGVIDAHRNVPYAFYALVLLWADRDDEAATALERARVLGQRLGLTWDVPLQHLIRARLLARREQWDEAVAEAQAGLSYSEDLGGSVADVWLLCLLVRVALQQGDLEAAERHLAVADAEVGRSGQGAGDAAEARGLLLEAQGEPELASDWFELLWDEYGTRELWSYQWDIAEDLVRIAVTAGRTARVAAVLEGLERLAVEFPDTKAPAVAERCRAAAAGSRPAQKTGATATFGWASLTKREREVVDLVAASLTNAEIAEKLFCSRRTVESHLNHVYTKLDVGSRVELAVEALKRDQ